MRRDFCVSPVVLYLHSVAHPPLDSHSHRLDPPDPFRSAGQPNFVLLYLSTSQQSNGASPVPSAF
eukprot:752091-Hanusia_phi.AAC.1